MSDAIAFLSRAIEQGQGLAKADVVLKGGRIFDLVSGDLVASDVAICNDRIVGHARRIQRRARDRRPRQDHRSGLHRHPLPCRNPRSSRRSNSTAACCATASRRRSAIRTRSATCWGRRACAISSTARWRPRWTCACSSRAACPRPNLETSGARLEVDDLLPLADHPKVLGLAEFMNFPGLLARDPACLAKLAAFQTRPIDGHSPLLGGYALNGYLAPASAPITKSPTFPRRDEKLSKGMQVLIREGSVCKDLHALSAHHHRAQFALHRLLHRRPQSARHRRGGPSRFPHPHRDQARRAAARRLSRRDDLGRAHFRPARPRARRARLAGRSRRSSTISKHCAVSMVLAAGARGGRRAVRRARRAAGRSGATASRRAASSRRISSREGRGLRPRRSASFPARSSPSASPVTLPFRNGERGVDLDQDVVKVSVVARHGVNDNIATAFVKGFGMKRGRDRLVGRPRQPQPLRRRNERGRHGRRRQPAARDRGRALPWRTAARSSPNCRSRSRG